MLCVSGCGGCSSAFLKPSAGQMGCAGKRVLALLGKRVEEHPHPQVTVRVIKQLLSEAVWSFSLQV